MQIPLFQQHYWQFKNIQYQALDLIDQCEQNKEWYSRVSTSRNTNGKEYDWKPFLNMISPLFKQLPIKGTGKFIFDTPWMNVYEKGSYQEVHSHAQMAELSYVYFHTLSNHKDNGKFMFFNNDYYNWVRNITWDYDQLGLYQWIELNVEQGDLIIFPSWFLHQVSEHKSDDTRITISGNVQVWM